MSPLDDNTDDEGKVRFLKQQTMENANETVTMLDFQQHTIAKLKDDMAEKDKTHTRLTTKKEEACALLLAAKDETHTQVLAEKTEAFGVLLKEKDKDCSLLLEQNNVAYNCKLAEEEKTWQRLLGKKDDDHTRLMAEKEEEKNDRLLVIECKLEATLTEKKGLENQLKKAHGHWKEAHENYAKQQEEKGSGGNSSKAIATTAQPETTGASLATTPLLTTSPVAPADGKRYSPMRDTTTATVLMRATTKTTEGTVLKETPPRKRAGDDTSPPPAKRPATTHKDVVHKIILALMKVNECSCATQKNLDDFFKTDLEVIKEAAADLKVIKKDLEKQGGKTKTGIAIALDGVLKYIDDADSVIFETVGKELHSGDDIFQVGHNQATNQDGGMGDAGGADNVPGRKGDAV